MSHVTTIAEATSPRLVVRDARTAGALYMGLALSGALGFLVVRPRLFEAGDALATQSNVLAHESLAQLGLLLELALVLTQALAALWFYRLFRPADSFAAGAIAVFGMANALAILGSAAALGAALEAAEGAAGDGATWLMYVLSENFWAAGNLFFGLWLIPMGVAVLRSGWAPRPLGLLLVVGGPGYVLSAFVAPLLSGSAETMVAVLALPATAGEFWMIGWLLLTRRSAPGALSGSE